jgi:ATPase family AAA domain-containing protein 3A/B
MSGGDVGPLGSDAVRLPFFRYFRTDLGLLCLHAAPIRFQVTELHRLFAWAAATKRGLLLFIDEAEAFLGARSR